MRVLISILIIYVLLSSLRVALTERGRVYSCGWGADGQTGLEHFKTYSKLTRLLGDIENEKIVKVSSVCDFVLAMNSKC